MRGTSIKLFFFLVLSGLDYSNSYGQNESLLAEVRLALKAGSAKELSQYFHDNVEVNIKDESGNYSRIHAEIYLKEFFKNIEPISFEYVLQRSTDNGLKYAIGNYTYSEGKYLVLIRAKIINGKEKIYIIDFSED